MSAGGYHRKTLIIWSITKKEILIFHEHVYFFTAYIGHEEKSLKTLQVIQELRGGNHPVWLRFSNDLRGDNAGWHTESLDSMPLLKGFEETGNMDMLIKGYAGAMGVAAKAYILEEAS